jgi:hypothetical protein
MLFLFLLLILAAVLISWRAQSRRQHREMMSALNPERLAELDAEARAEARAQWIARLGIVGGAIAISLFFWTCAEIPKIWAPKHLSEQTANR